MLIEQKLTVSRNPIAFIQEGGFIKVYNQSLYVLATQYNYPLKPNIKFIKKINQTIIYGGLPARYLLHYFPNISRTDFGYQLNGHFDLSDYPQWFFYQLNTQ